MKKLMLPERWKKTLVAVGMSVAAFASIGFMEKQQGEKSCRKIIIQVENTFKNYFIDEKDILQLITHNGSRQIVGASLEAINLKEIENEASQHAFVKRADAYKDLKGNLVVNIEQRRPVARIVRSRAPDAYISEDGEILPLSERYSARTVILHGPYADRLIAEGLNEKNGGHKLLGMLNFMVGNDFWNAHIAEIVFDAKGNMVFYPQVGKQEFEFGSADNYEEKFKKLNIFLDKILPLKGWNYYDRVNLKFKNQIICE